MNILEFHYVGGLRLELVAFNVQKIVSVQKPKSDAYGCIISTEDGEKYPVSETYDYVLTLWKTNLGS